MGMVGAIGKTQANVLQALGQLDAAFGILVGHGAARNLLVVDEELCFINRLQPKTIDPRLRDRDLARPLHRVGAGQGRNMEIEVELRVDARQGLGPLPVAIAVIFAQQPVAGDWGNIERGRRNQLRFAIRRTPGQADRTLAANRA